MVQTVAIGYYLVPAFGHDFGASELIALLGFQVFAVAAVALARRESEARATLARTNAELLATRSLLDEVTRAQERTRIARDLHDVLGHNLTALGLQLEIASHVEEKEARVQVGKARELTARLLGDVREVVGAMRPERSPTLLAAIRELVIEVPGLAVHLDVPESLVVEESCRAECVVRCIQEIVTNARRPRPEPRTSGSVSGGRRIRSRSKRTTTERGRAACRTATVSAGCARASRRWGAGSK